MNNPKESNLQHIMNLYGWSSYIELHAWSVNEPGAYAQLLVEHLKIEFKKQATRVLDLSCGAHSPRWFVDAKMNIVDSCWGGDTDRIAVVSQTEGGETSTFSLMQLRELANRISNGLIARGISSGTAIGIVLPLTVECVAVYLGVIQAGCVAVPIPDSFTSNEIVKRLTVAGARFLFTRDTIEHGGRRFPLYSRLADSVDIPIVVLGNEHPQGEDLHWNDFLSDVITFESVSCEPSDPVTILFSSGTTGDPKAIVWDHTTPLKCAGDGYFHQNIQPGDRVCWPTNLGWMMGPWLIFATLINRGVIALYQGVPDRRFGEFIELQRINVLGVIPSLVRKWRDSACMEGLNWSGLKLFSSTGECSNAEHMAYLMSLANNSPVIEYCGGTEIGGGYLTSTVLAESVPATFTTAAMGSEFVLLDEMGKPTDRGEAFLRTPAIGLSTKLLNFDHHTTYYCGVPQDNPGRPLRRHGDHVERLSNGRFRVLGRIDDTMNIGGIKVGSAEIERVLNGIEGIMETAAIGVSPMNGGPEQLVIYVVMPRDQQYSLETVQRAMQQRIKEELNPLFKIHMVCTIASLPRTASHKVMRRSLKAMYENEQKTFAVSML